MSKCLNNFAFFSLISIILLFNRDQGTCSKEEPDSSNFFYPPEVDLENLGLKECNCDLGTQECPANAEGIDPPMIQMSSYDILQNLTGRNISDFLVKTRKQYYKQRYGGFEFGVRNPLSNMNITMLEEVTDRLLRVNSLYIE